jgi:hypothetical protein
MPQIKRRAPVQLQPTSNPDAIKAPQQWASSKGKVENWSLSNMVLVEVDLRELQIALSAKSSSYKSLERHDLSLALLVSLLSTRSSSS